MRDQYAGDISDYLKFAFLRTVSCAGTRLGVAWYYLAGHDGRSDGRHEEYLSDVRWRALDPDLFERLRSRAHRSVAELEALGVLDQRTVFHRAPVPPPRQRDDWRAGMLGALAGCDAVFADPDNGVSRVGVVSRKSATVAEVSALAADGREVFLIRFPHRLTSHDEQLANYHATFAALAPLTLRTCVRVPNGAGTTSPRIRWFTALNPSAETRARIELFAGGLDALPGATSQIQ